MNWVLLNRSMLRTMNLMDSQLLTMCYNAFLIALWKLKKFNHGFEELIKNVVYKWNCERNLHHNQQTNVIMENVEVIKNTKGGAKLLYGGTYTRKNRSKTTILQTDTIPIDPLNI